MERQIEKNESVKKKMKNDIVHKESAYGIDDTCVGLNNMSCKIQSNPGVEEVVTAVMSSLIIVEPSQEDKTCSTPLSWDQHSDGNWKSSTGKAVLIAGICMIAEQMPGLSQQSSEVRWMDCLAVHARNS